MRSAKKILIAILSSSLLWSCGPKKYFTQDDNLLVATTIICDNSSIDVSYPEEYIKQKPIRKILGIALHARLYNSFDPQKIENQKAKIQKEIDSINVKRKDKHDKKCADINNQVRSLERQANFYIEANDTIKAKKYLEKAVVKKQKHNLLTRKGYNEKTKKFNFPIFVQKIGEEPIKYKRELTEKSARQIELYLRNRGYYEAKVTYTEKTKHQNTKVVYQIATGQPTTIQNITYTFTEENIANQVLSDTSNSLIKTNNLLDVDILQQERERIANNLKNCGYYRFTKDYIEYEIDTIGKNHTADIVVAILPVYLDNGRIIQHGRYYISNVQVFPKHNNQLALSDREDYFSNMDTLVYKPNETSKGNILFIRKNGQDVKPQVVDNEIYVRPKSTYSQKATNDTYKHLSAFNVYKVINIEYEPTSSRDSLNCNIYLSNNPLQAYIAEVENTNKSGNIGAGVGFTYKHNNIFHGAETFDLKLTTAFESQNNLSKEQMALHLNTQEYGIETKLYFPRLLSPGFFKRYAREYNPKTYFSLGANYRQRPDYTRTSINASIYYQWQSGKYLNHTFTPLRLNAIRISKADSAFMAWLEQLYIKDSYQDHFIFGSTYSIGFNNQSSGKRNYFYTKLNLSWAGNLLHLLNKQFGGQMDGDSYIVPLLNLRYAQFVKSDIDWRYYLKINSNVNLVYRLYFGIGFAYGNNRQLPFSEQFFSGGANSIRAWQIRSIGPGSSTAGLEREYPNQTADMKIEANLEYRFKLFWVLEGAWFVDAGNIWTVHREEMRQGGQFSPSTFYKELAVGSGFGTRLDFDFFVLRLDFGLKLHNPALQEGKRWLIQNDELFFLRGRNWTFNLGIGYPF